MLRVTQFEDLDVQTTALATFAAPNYAYNPAGRRTGVGGSFVRANAPQAVSSASYNVNNQLTQLERREPLLRPQRQPHQRRVVCVLDILAGR